MYDTKIDKAQFLGYPYCVIIFICVVGIVFGKQIFFVQNNTVIVILWKDYVVGIIFSTRKIFK